jgi:hypothetical protein
MNYGTQQRLYAVCFLTSSIDLVSCFESEVWGVLIQFPRCSSTEPLRLSDFLFRISVVVLKFTCDLDACLPYTKFHLPELSKYMQCISGFSCQHLITSMILLDES